MDLSNKEVNEIIDKVCDFLHNQVLRSDIIFAQSLIRDLQKVKKNYPLGGYPPPPKDRRYFEGEEPTKPNIVTWESIKHLKNGN